MAIFTKTTKKEGKASKKAVTTASAGEKALKNSKLENIIKAPWLSEKALIGTERGVYVFSVTTEATKPDIKAAIERMYKVVPVKVNIVNTEGKTKALRTKRGIGRRALRRKAYVYLKKGESITFA